METEDVKLSICIALKVGCGSLVTHPGREYDDQAQQQKRDVLGFESMKNQFGLSVIYYTALKPNFTEILDTKLTQEQKAELLARAAIDSVTHETYRKGGGRYPLPGRQYRSKCGNSADRALRTGYFG